MSRSSTTTTESETVDTSTETTVESSTTDSSVTTTESTVETTTTVASTSSATITTTSNVLSPTKKIGIVRYLQLHPLGNRTLELTLKKMYSKEVHTEDEWVTVIEDFLNS